MPGETKEQAMHLSEKKEYFQRVAAISYYIQFEMQKAGLIKLLPDSNMSSLQNWHSLIPWDGSLLVRTGKYSGVATTFCTFLGGFPIYFDAGALDGHRAKIFMDKLSNKLELYPYKPKKDNSDDVNETAIFLVHRDLDGKPFPFSTYPRSYFVESSETDSELLQAQWDRLKPDFNRAKESARKAASLYTEEELAKISEIDNEAFFEGLERYRLRQGLPVLGRTPEQNLSQHTVPAEEEVAVCEAAPLMRSFR